MSPFKHLIRFKNASAKIFYGEAESVAVSDTSLVGRKVYIFDGESPWDDNFQLTGRAETIAEVNKRFLAEISVSEEVKNHANYHT